MPGIVYYFTFLIFFCALNAQSGKGENSSGKGKSKKPKAYEILNSLSQNDSLRLWPGYETGKPVDVKVGFYFQSLHTFDHIEQVFGFTCYMRLSWADPRLTFPKEVGDISFKYKDIQDSIWTPDVFLRQARFESQHGAIDEESAMGLWPNGRIWVVFKKTINFDCPMDLTRFPFDIQKCRLFLECYFHRYSQVRLSWMNPDMDINAEHPSYKLVNISKGSHLANYSVGIFQTMYMDFTFRRLYGHYVVYWFLPIMAISGLAYLQFWLPEDSLSAKTTLGSIWFLSFLFMMAISRVDAPQVPYMTAIDQWFLVHLLFLTLSVLEVILLHLVQRMVAGQSTARFHMMGTEEDPEKASPVSAPPMTYKERIIRRVLWVMRIVYPAAYILFLAIYWGIYRK